MLEWLRISDETREALRDSIERSFIDTYDMGHVNCKKFTVFAEMLFTIEEIRERLKRLSSEHFESWLDATMQRLINELRFPHIFLVFRQAIFIMKTREELNINALLQRTKPLVLIRDVSPALAKDYRALFEWTYEGRLLTLDSSDSSALCLIYALTVHPDFMLTDILCYDLRLHEMLDYFKRFPETRDIPYSIITAMRPEDAYRDRAKHYIGKPFLVSEVFAAINDHLLDAGFTDVVEAWMTNPENLDAV